MLKFSEQIAEAAKKQAIKIKIMSEEEFSQIFNTVKEKYINSSAKGLFLWEKLNGPEQLYDRNGWKYIKEFVKDTPCILFFNKEDDKNAVIIHNGTELEILLGETYGFEFYITNHNADYLISFNHHDCLIGCGEAGIWIQFMESGAAK